MIVNKAAKLVFFSDNEHRVSLNNA